LTVLFAGLFVSPAHAEFHKSPIFSTGYPSMVTSALFDENTEPYYFQAIPICCSLIP